MLPVTPRISDMMLSLAIAGAMSEGAPRQAFSAGLSQSSLGRSGGSSKKKRAKRFARSKGRRMRSGR